MNKKIYAHKLWLVVGLCLMFALSSSNAFAWGRDRDKGRDSSHREFVKVGHERYNYHDGRFYRPWWFGFEFALFSPPIGAIVRILPAGHRTVISSDVTYYYYDNIYYTACSSGYIVVPEPAPAAQPQISNGETVTINVPNTNGSYTPITLVRRNNGYIGPQGEYYPAHPTVEQLRVLYGK